MKKLVAALLLAAALLSLAACGSGEESAVHAAPAPETAAPRTPAPETAAPAPAAPPMPTPPIEPGDEELVRVQDCLPELRVELRYAGAHNFTGSPVYDFPEAWLRYGTVKKLAAAQESLRPQGYGLLIWDAFRPQSAQFALWAAVPDPVYVANPYTGHSSHSNGGTVDITLVTLEGDPVEMPSGFDEFSPLADRDYSDVSPAAAEHARILENAMTGAGFVPYAGEWWHYSDSDAYPFADVEGLTLPGRGALYTPSGAETILLRMTPDNDAKTLARISRGETFVIEGFAGDYVRVSWKNRTGYVLREQIMPVE